MCPVQEIDPKSIHFVQGLLNKEPSIANQIRLVQGSAQDFVKNFDEVSTYDFVLEDAFSPKARHFSGQG